MNPLIEKYFEGNLDDTEKKELEKEIKADPTLADEFQFHRDLKTAIHLKERKELKTYLQTLEKPRRKISWQLVSGVAAAIFLALAILFFLPSNKNKQLAIDYFQPLPNMVSPTVRGEVSESAYILAFQYYDLEEYNKAAEEFLSLNSSSYSAVYAGVSYMAAGKFYRGVEILKLGPVEDAAFEAYRKWYLGLGYLKLGKTDQAKDLFTQLSVNSSPVKELAVKILSELE